MANDELSWQTAFWCLAAVALNAMSQPAGSTLGLPDKYSFYIRSSPVVCLGHISYTVYQIFSGARSYQSFSASLEMWKDIRFEDTTSGEDNKFESFRKSTLVRLVLFVLGALLPALKIYACKRIPWTQTTCSIYLTCFALDEALLLACRLTRSSHQFLASSRPPPPLISRYTTATWTIIAFDCGLLSTLLIQAALGFELFIETNAFFPLCAIGPLVLAFYTSCEAEDDSEFRSLLPVASFSLGPLLWLCEKYTVRTYFFPTDGDAPKSGYILVALFAQLITSLAATLGIWICVYLTCRSSLARRYMDAVATRLGSRYQLISARSHAAFWLVVCVLTCARMYNPEGTYDPGWLHVFG